jgi:hypothetical protein
MTKLKYAHQDVYWNFARFDALRQIKELSGGKPALYGEFLPGLNMVLQKIHAIASEALGDNDD